MRSAKVAFLAWWLVVTLSLSGCDSLLNAAAKNSSYLGAKSVVSDPDTGDMLVTWAELEGATGDVVYMVYGGPDDKDLMASVTGSTSWTNSDFTPGATYQVRVVAVDSKSGQKYEGVQSIPYTAPQSIIRFNGCNAAAAAGPTTMTITWDAATRADSYVIYRSADLVNAIRTIAAKDLLGNAATNVLLDGLTLNTRYEFVCRACRNGICDKNLNTVAARTLAYSVPESTGVAAVQQLTGPQAVSQLEVVFGEASFPLNSVGADICSATRGWRIYARSSSGSYVYTTPAMLSGANVSNSILGPYISVSNLSAVVTQLNTSTTTALSAGNTYCFVARAFCLAAGSGTLLNDLNAVERCGSTPSTPPPPVPPTISLVAPSAGPIAGGQLITVDGSNFQAGLTATFDGGYPCGNPTVISPSQFQCTTPAHALGSVDIAVTNPDTGSVSLSSAYSFSDALPPALYSVFQSSGPTTGNRQVTLTGAHFRSGMTAKFGTGDCVGLTPTGTAVANEYTTATCFTPAQSSGSVTVVVTNLDGQTGTSPNAYTYVGPPTLNSIDPQQVGTSGGVTLSLFGTNFRVGMTIDIGGDACTAVQLLAGGTKAQCSVPAKAVQGNYTVTVVNADTQSASLVAALTYVGPPSVNAIVPLGGSINGGTSIGIAGSGFQAGAIVNIGGSDCTGVSILDSANLTCTSSAHVAGTADVRVINPDSQYGLLSSAYQYNAAPTITSVTPYIGPTSGGTLITLVGTFQISPQPSIRVGTANVPALNFVSLSGTQIRFTTPASPAGTAIVPIKVTSWDGQEVIRTQGFSYTDFGAPTVASITSSVGTPAGAQTRAVVGTNFRSGAKVYFISPADVSTESPLVTYNSATSLTVTTPALSVLSGGQTYSVKVVNTDLQEGTLSSAYTIVSTSGPTVASVSPRFGSPSGGTVAVTGTNFYTAVKPLVYFGTTLADSTSMSSLTSTGFSITAPAHSAGLVNVKVVNPDDQTDTLTDGYSYTSASAPTVVSIASSVGQPVGIQTRTITGTNFQNGATVSFVDPGTGTAYAATGVTFNSATSLTVTTPALSVLSGGQKYGVRVTNPDYQVATTTALYLVITLSAPTVTSVASDNSTTTGGATVVITGTNFYSTVTPTVYFGTTQVPPSSIGAVTATTITLTNPSHVAGFVDVKVINADDQQYTLADAFSYTTLTAPTVTGITPNTGSPTGGISRTIAGTDFVSGVQVWFFYGSLSYAATGVTFNSATSLTVTPPTLPLLGVGEKYSIRVKNPDYQTATTSSPVYLVVNFAAPTLSSLSSSYGVPAGGATVNFFGTGFRSGIQAFIGTTACATTSYVNSTSLTCTTPVGVTGVYNVKVVNDDTQLAQLNNAWTYTGTPTIIGVSPTQANFRGGFTLTLDTTLVLSGAAVDLVTGGTARPCTGVVVQSGGTSVSCTAPAFYYGTYDVRVTNPDAVTATLPGAITYQPAPLVHNVTPNASLAATGGTVVTITGANFVAGVVAAIVDSGGTTLCQNTFYDSVYQIRCVTPAHASGDVDLKVTNSDGQSYTYANALRFVAPRSLNTLTKLGGYDAANAYIDGAVSSARFASPYAVVRTGTRLYVADRYGRSIRSVDLTGQTVSTAFGSQWNGGNTTCQTANTTVSSSAAKFVEPINMTLQGTTLWVWDNSCGLYFIDLGTGNVTRTSIGRTYNATGMTVDSTYVYLSDFDHCVIMRYNPGTANYVQLVGGYNTCTTPVAGANFTNARFNRPVGLAYVSTNNSIYVADRTNYVLQRIDLTGLTVSTVAGLAGTNTFVDGTLGTNRLVLPTHIVYLNSKLYFFDDKRIRSYDPGTGQVTAVFNQYVDAFYTAANTQSYIDSNLTALRATTWGGDWDTNNLWPYYDGTHYLLYFIHRNNASQTAVRVLNLTLDKTGMIAGYANNATVFDGLNSFASLPSPLPSITDGTGAAFRVNNVRSMTSLGDYIYFCDDTASAIRRLDPATNTVITMTTTGATIGSTCWLTNDGIDLYVTDYNQWVIWRLVISGTSVAATRISGITSSGGYVDGGFGSSKLYYPRVPTTDGRKVYFVSRDGANTTWRMVRSVTIDTLVTATHAGSNTTTGDPALGTSTSNILFNNADALTLNGKDLVVRDFVTSAVAPPVIGTNSYRIMSMSLADNSITWLTNGQIDDFTVFDDKLWGTAGQTFRYFLYGGSQYNYTQYNASSDYVNYGMQSGTFADPLSMNTWNPHSGVFHKGSYYFANQNAGIWRLD